MKMRRDRKIGSKAYIRSFLVRRTWRVILSFAGLVVATASVLVACSAPQSQTSQPNNQQQGAAADWKQVEQAIGKAGNVQPDGVYKIGLPRTDLHVKVGDVEVKPTLALGSWVAFRKMAAETMVMGDLVLTEDEVGPVMGKLQEGKIDIHRFADTKVTEGEGNAKGQHEPETPVQVDTKPAEHQGLKVGAKQDK